MTDTSNLNPLQTAAVIGSVVTSALAQAAGALDALRTANQAFYDGDVEKATLAVRNYLTTFDTDYGVLVNLDSAIYDALPRGNDATSYG